MAELDPDDRDLRDAFDSFRTHALDGVAAPGADAVRGAARHRRRVHQTVAAAAAGVVLIGGAGGALLATHRQPSPGGVTAAASASTRHRSPAPTTTAPESGGTGGPGTSPGQSSTELGPPAGTPAMAVSVGSAPMMMRSGSYDTQMTIKVRNTGHRPIATAVVLIDVPEGMSVRSDGECTEDGCPIGSLRELAPGDEQSVVGTLSYPQDQDTTPATTGTVTVTARDEAGTALPSVSKPFQVDTGASPSPTGGGDGAPSPSPSPATPTPAPASS